MFEKKAPGRPSKKPSAQQLEMLYSAMTAKEVAAMYGVSEMTVRRWITAYRKELTNAKED